ncbi:endonuclease/exonuclease/phosphatase family protein [Anaeromyxobacter sp. Fw109-5]|uniref:endonuclease/exonuclease/phosphatase family protein n=1 Tax=Anaeromyxobacter sp. (strain Fw109-5) TaxID=404589 RepID=UPI0000ED7548|nr:endonuclease/exonuclease/phosphatase family protein [Anaeromyxobacter sp. Fw109-5]ABS26871.1 Endonuclease/exonuclease/phosphatase [Anaeromyxobacter sp. Fw109-5]
MRILSWNVHSLRGTDGRRDPERIARVIADLRPDIAGLQEVGGELAADGPRDVAEALASLTGMRSTFGPTMSFRGHPYGNGILTRHPIEATRTYDLSVRGREPRGCLRADVEVGGVRVHFFSAHLGLHWRERRKQAAQLLSADILRDTALAHPLVLVGDFNSLSNRSAVPRWLRRQLVDCAHAARNEAPTFPSRFPLLRLDRVFVDSAFRVVGCEVVHTPLARRASDHLPLVVDLEPAESARRPPAPRAIEVAGVTTTVAP